MTQPEVEHPAEPAPRPTGGSGGQSGAVWTMLREAIAVLLAILLAFGLDAWWGALDERTELERQLEAVGVELTAALEEVERTLLPSYLTRKERFLLLRSEDIAILPADSTARLMDH